MKRICLQCGRGFYDKGQSTECCNKCCNKSDCVGCRGTIILWNFGQI